MTSLCYPYPWDQCEPSGTNRLGWILNYEEAAPAKVCMLPTSVCVCVCVCVVLGVKSIQLGVTTVVLGVETVKTVESSP